MKRKRAARPRLFVGSSSESLDYAYAIQSNLDECAEVTVWKQGIFEISKTAVESLIKALDKSDFGVFVFAPNDALRLRRKKFAAVRDNVVLELGLFMGKLGRSRTFVVVPKATAQLRIPTDLMGVALGEFDSNRKDKNLEAALGPFCHIVRRQVRKVGPRIRRNARSVRRVGPRIRRNARSGAESDSQPVVVVKEFFHHTGNVDITQISGGSRPTGDLVVTEAVYGTADHHIDVTAKLNDLISGNKLRVYAGNQLGGDPCPNTAKSMMVKYQYKGQELERNVKEGATLDLP